MDDLMRITDCVSHQINGIDVTDDDDFYLLYRLSHIVIPLINFPNLVTFYYC